MEGFYWSAFGNIRYTLFSSQPAHSPLQLSLAAPTLDTRSGTAVPEWIQRMKMREAACNRLCSSCINFSLSLYSPSTVMLIHSTRIHCNIGKLHFNTTETEAGFLLHIALSAHLRQRQQAERWDRCGQLCLTYGPHVPPGNVWLFKGVLEATEMFSNLLCKQTGPTPARDKLC